MLSGWLIEPKMPKLNFETSTPKNIKEQRMRKKENPENRGKPLRKKKLTRIIFSVILVVFLKTIS